MSEEELQREIVSGAFSMQVADCERNIRIQFEKLQQENQKLKIEISARETVCDELQERINKVEKGIKHYMSYNTNEGLLEYCMSDLLSLLKGDKE